VTEGHCGHLSRKDTRSTDDNMILIRCDSDDKHRACFNVA